MSDISNELAGIAGKARKLAVPFASAIARHESVGIGELGPLSQFQNLADVIASCLDELSEEAGLGGKILKLRLTTSTLRMKRAEELSIRSSTILKTTPKEMTDGS